MNLKFYSKMLSVFCLFLLLGIANIQAQTVAAGYAFSQQSGAYAEITGGTVLGTGTIDDTSYPNQPIGFSFVFNGITYTSFGVNANGWVMLGGGTMSSSYTSLSTGASNNIIAALNYDLQGLAAGGELRYQTIGTTPNQQLVIQFKNWSSWSSTTNNNESFNFQVILTELSNTIQIQYGTMTKNATSRTPQVGLRGASNADFNNRTTSTDWATTTSGGANNATCTFSPTVFPSSGLTFVWTPIDITISNSTISPAGPSCNAVAHAVTVDVAGVPDITDVVLNYTVNGVAQTPVVMALTSGTAASGTWSGTIPPASGTGVLAVSYSYSVTNALAQVGGPFTGGSYVENYLGVNAGPDQILGVGLSTTLNASANDPALFPVVFSEITHFETGTGATSPYPAYTSVTTVDWDGLEIQNIHATNSVNIGGLLINIWTSATNQLNYTIPANTVVPAGGVAVFAYNNVASDPANLFFSMGGLTPTPSSASNYGYILKTPTGAILDVVGTGTFVFPATSGVSAANWSGNIPSSSGRAGVVRIGANDTNTAADWAISNTVAAGGPIQTIGTFNAAIAQVNSTAGAFTWTPGGATTQSIVVGPFAPGTYTYSVSYNDGSCVQADSVSIVVPDCPAPTVFAVSGVIDTAATFSWVSGGGTVDTTIIEYGPVGFAQGTGTQVIVTGNPATVISFLPNTTYQAYVFESCDASAGTSFYSNSVSFTTTCSPNPYFGNTIAAPIVVNTFPFTYTVNANEWACYSNNNANRASRDVFFQFTADSCATTATVQLCNSSVSWDTYLTILASNGTTTVVTSDDVCGVHPNVTFAVQPGVTYYAMVEPFSTAAAAPTNPFTIDITQNVGTPAPAFTIAGVQPTCATALNGSAAVTVTNVNKAPITYLWNTGDTTASISGVGVGTYVVTVTNGCGGFKVDSITLNSSFELSVASSSNVLCAGGNSGAIDVTVAGGIPPYAFAWDNGATSEDLTNLVAGTYSLTVSDAGACQLSTSVTITEPSQIVVAIDTINAVACNGAADGSIQLTVSGGTNLPPVPGSLATLFATNNGCGAGNMFNLTVNTDLEITGFDLSMGTVTGPVVIYYKTGAYQGFEANAGAWTQIYSGTVSGAGTNIPTPTTLVSALALTAGNYAFYVNADLDYTNLASGTLYSDANMTISSGAGFCTAFTGPIDGRAWNGRVNYTIPGATYTYLWSNGLTSEDAVGLAAGSYTMTVIDGNNCNYTTPSIPVTEPSALAIAMLDSGNVSCNAGADGFVEVMISGGTLPYTHNWSNGGTTAMLSSLMAGSYTDTVMDANGCMLVAGPIAVTEPTALSAAVDSTFNVSLCAGDTTGAIYVSLAGGTAPYSYSWSNGATSEDLVNLGAGSYTGTVTDANGCVLVAGPIVITEPAAISVDAVLVSNANCAGDSTGAIDILVSGGTAPFSYSWSNGATSEDLTNLPAGSYTGVITDSNACVLSAGPVVVSEPSALSYTALNLAMVSCNGANDGAIDVLIQGGTMPYIYAWSNGDSTASISGLEAGIYNAKITDANGCELFSPDETVTQPDSLVAVATATQMSAAGANDGAIALSVVGGTAPYSYNWSDGSTGTSLSGLSGGAYGVVVVDANGCFAAAAANIVVLTSISDIAGVNVYEMYPNPTQDVATIKMELEELQEVSFQLFSIDGKLMIAQSFGRTQNMNFNLDLSGYASGMYITKVLVGQEVIVDRIVVNK